MLQGAPGGVRTRPGSHRRRRTIMVRNYMKKGSHSGRRSGAGLAPGALGAASWPQGRRCCEEGQAGGCGHGSPAHTTAMGGLDSTAICAAASTAAVAATAGSQQHEQQQQQHEPELG